MGPTIDLNKCEGCGNCIEVCPAGVYEIAGDEANAARPDDCLDCGACAEECPVQAITV